MGISAGWRARLESAGARIAWACSEEQGVATSQWLVGCGKASCSPVRQTVSSLPPASSRAQAPGTIPVPWGVSRDEQFGMTRNVAPCHEEQWKKC